ncbi:MAG: nuclear transport factor 2 family protein [Pseudomonadales bacterium]|nr:nuclear transport factor 2 family protein [Pseudomonadales bacterium]
MSQEQDNKKRVEEFFVAMQKGDGQALAAAYADDGYVQTMGSTLISGKRGKKEIEQFASGVLQAFPEGLTFTINGMIAEGEKVAVEAESDGMHVSGLRYINQYHFLFEFENGQLKVLKEYMDTEQVTDVLCGGQRPA